MRTVDPLTETRDTRLELCDLLDILRDEQWDAPSLCAGWSVHHVVAHLTTSTRTSVLDMALGMLRSGFDFDRMERVRAEHLAAEHRPAELVTMLRQTAGSASRAPGATPLDPLLDTLVHSLDITRPLEIAWPVGARRGVPALDHAVSSRWYGARARLRDLHLEASDADWRHDCGPRQVVGTLADLLLVATGRPAGLAGLTGDGVQQLADRLTP